jgi:pimeloyl-ACP methyl ester carboxylesterase
MASRAEESYRARRTFGAEYFRSRRAIGDLTVDVRRFPASNENGPDFVLVHGIGISARYFHPTAAELSRFGTVWLIDLPGYGSSPNPRRNVSIDEHASVVAGFVREQELDRPVVVGHSMGSQVVAALGEQHPDVSSRIVLMAPTMPPSARTPLAAMSLLARDMLRESWRVRYITATDVVFRSGIGWVLRQLRYLLGDSIESRRISPAVSTLVIVGESDTIVPVEWAKQCAIAAHGSVAVVAGAHVVMHSDPVDVARLIAQHASSGDLVT